MAIGINIKEQEKEGKEQKEQGSNKKREVPFTYIFKNNKKYLWYKNIVIKQVVRIHLES